MVEVAGIYYEKLFRIGRMDAVNKATLIEDAQRPETGRNETGASCI